MLGHEEGQEGCKEELFCRPAEREILKSCPATCSVPATSSEGAAGAHQDSLEFSDIRRSFLLLAA